MNKLTLAKGKGFALVDDDDFDKVNLHKWYLVTKSTVHYARTDIDGYNIAMHRFILGLKKGDPAVDHVDCDGLNNQKANLRLATGSQNNQNQRKQQGTSSKYKGVYIDKRRNRNPCRAYIYKDGRRIHLGCFDNELDAARKYDIAAAQEFKEFARTNNIEDTILPPVYKPVGFGVYQRINTWTAYIFIGDKTKYVGSFRTHDIALECAIKNRLGYDLSQTSV